MLEGSSACYFVSPLCLNSIWKASDSYTGYWSFDLFLATNHTFFIFYFIGLSSSNGIHPEQGYTFHINDTRGFDLRYRYSNSVRGPLDSYYPPSSETNTWMHIDIARNNTGYMQVFLNEELILKGQDNTYQSSENINFQLEPNAKIDNVSYEQQLPGNLSSSSSSQTINFDLISSFLVIGSLSLIIRKKKNNKN